MNYGLMVSLVMPFLLDASWKYYCIGYAILVSILWLVYFISYYNNFILTKEHFKLVCEFTTWMIIPFAVACGYYKEEEIAMVGFGYCIANIALWLVYVRLIYLTEANHD